MQQFQVDTEGYIFFDQEVKYTYQHKYLVPDTEDETNEDPDMWLGPEEKWGKWTDLGPREFSLKYNVSVLQTRKKPVR